MLQWQKEHNEKLQLQTQASEVSNGIKAYGKPAPAFLKADSMPSPNNKVFKKKKAADFYFQKGAQKSPTTRTVDIMSQGLKSPP